MYLHFLQAGPVRFFVFVALTFTTFISSAQRSGTLEYEDGTSVDLKIISVDPDEGRNACIYLGAFGPEGLNA
jgi:hypothetical protein